MPASSTSRGVEVVGEQRSDIIATRKRLDR
jgi:hypothetical protein